MARLSPAFGTRSVPRHDGTAARGLAHRRHRVLWYVGPAVGLLGLTTYLPAVVSVVTSLFDVPLTGGLGPFVGLDNYESIIQDARVQQAVVNTVFYTGLTVVPSLVIGLSLALIVARLGRSASAVSTLLFLPLTANLVAMSVTFRWIFASPGGFANQVLALVGLGPVNFLGDPSTALPAVATVGLWRQASFSFILFSAGLTAIPGVIDEAAATDGLTGLTKLRLVTLPLLRPTIILATALAVLGALQVFDAVEVMTGGGPLGATETLLTITWRIGIAQFHLGHAAALSFLSLVVLLVISWARRSQILSGEPR